MSAAYPLFLRLEGRRVLIVGGGVVARDKAAAVRAAGAVVSVVAPEVDAELATAAHDVSRREFVASDVDGAWFVIAAATPGVNATVKRAADARERFVVAVDDVASCSAIGAALLHRGGLTLAISSDGRAPALVALLRRALEAVLPDDVAQWMALAETSRLAWKAAKVPFLERRPLLLQALNSLYAPTQPASQS